MKKVSLALIVVLLLFACSKSDDFNNTNNAANFKDIAALAINDISVIQFDISNNAVNLNTENLTSTLGVPYTFDYFEDVYPTFTFYDGIFNSTVLDVYQNNIVTSESFTRSAPCSIVSGELLEFATTTQDKIVLMTSIDNTQNIYDQLFIKVHDNQSGNCTEIPIGSGEIYDHRTTLFADGNLLFVYFTTEANESKLIRINLNTNMLEDELILQDPFKATIKNDELLVFKTNATFDIYNKSTFGFIETRSLNTFVSFPIGLFRTSFYQDEMLTFIAYPQPSIVTGGPGTLSLTSGELVRGTNFYMFDVKNSLDLAYIEDGGISINSFATDIESNQVIVGFRINVPGTTGGVAYCDFDGNVNQIVELDHIPFHISIK